MASTYHKVSAASTNADTIKNEPGEVTGWILVNRTQAFRHVKLYNKASNPTVGTDTPKLTLSLQAGAVANVAFESPLEFDVGIAIAMVTGVADSDTAAVALNDLAVDVLYD